MIPQSKTIHLTTTQGLLMVAGIILVFGGLIYWSANRYPPSYKGSLTLTDASGATTNFEPFGCTSDENRPRMTIGLRPSPVPQGFHEENRALIVHENSGHNFTSRPEPAKSFTFAFRHQDRTETPANCTISEQTLTIQDEHITRRGRPDIDRHRWNGTLKATCTSEAGDINFAFDLQNCD